MVTSLVLLHVLLSYFSVFSKCSTINRFKFEDKKHYENKYNLHMYLITLKVLT